MSESMAFIGGVAVAGLAALVLLKGAGGNSLQQPNFAMSPQMPATVVPQVMPPPQYPYPQPVYPNQLPPGTTSEQRAELESAKSEVAKVKSDNEQLRAQIQQVQWQLQSYNQQQQQLQFAQQNNQKTALQPQNPWWSSPIVWAVGGMTLTIGGGVVVAGVLALFSPKQRPARTVQVIHPYQGTTPPLVPVRRAEFLPHRSETRRVEAPEYDEMR